MANDEAFIEPPLGSNNMSEPMRRQPRLGRRLPPPVAGYHVVTRRRSTKNNRRHDRYLRPTADDFAFPEMFTDHLRGTIMRQQRGKRQAYGSPVWPEILLVVDYETFILHEGNEERITRYGVCSACRCLIMALREK